MDRIKIFVLMVVLAALVSACGGGGTDVVAPQATATPTPTPTPPVIQGSGEVIHPQAGKITLEFLDAETQQTCTAEFPFTLDWEGEMAAVTGSGEINCPLTTQQCGDVCVTYHIEYLYAGDLGGNVSLATDPGKLQANLMLDGSLTQYWTDIPPGSVMAFTEDHPAVFEGADILPLLFDFEDGAVFTIENTLAPDAPPWVFTLHLGQ